MQVYSIVSARRRIVILTAIFGASSVLLAYGAWLYPDLVVILIGWTAFWVFALRHGLVSLRARPVTLQWNGTHLDAFDGTRLLARIEGATWVYRDAGGVMIAARTPIDRFTFGHVRSDGRELTLDGFFGRGLGDLPARLEILGPKRYWLWRRLPI